MDDGLHKGQPTTWSDIGRRFFPKQDPQRKGIIVAECRDGQCVRVHWAGLKRPTVLHRSFLEPVQR